MYKVGSARAGELGGLQLVVNLDFRRLERIDRNDHLFMQQGDSVYRNMASSRYRIR
ncbi:hypothetical protein JCM5350_007927 [Sporobolomyces pararoseus]